MIAIEETIVYLDNDELKNFVQEFPNYVYGINWKRVHKNKFNEITHADGYMEYYTFVSIQKFINLMDIGIFELYSIQNLNLQNMKLSELHKEIGLLYNLNVLEVSGNKLVDLPDSLSDRRSPPSSHRLRR